MANHITGRTDKQKVTHKNKKSRKTRLEKRAKDRETIFSEAKKAEQILSDAIAGDGTFKPNVEEAANLHSLIVKAEELQTRLNSYK
jgi:putative lipase involved disintegration of autophagic bodies